MIFLFPSYAMMDCWIDCCISKVYTQIDVYASIDESERS